MSGEAVWRRGGGWALERNTAEPVRAEQWSGGDRTRRADRRPHRTEPERLTCPNSGMTFAAAYAAWHCGSGAVCGGLVPTLSAPAAGTAASRLPGTLLAGFTPAEVWRNSGRVWPRRSRTEERSGVSEAGGLSDCLAYGERATQHRRCLRRQDARAARTLNAGDDGREALRLCVVAPR